MTAPAAAPPGSIRWFTCCAAEALRAVVAAVAVVLALAAPAFAADPAALARDVAQFMRTAPGAAAEAALRARIEAGFRDVRGKPAPDAALAHEGRAEAAVQMAKAPADFTIAAAEYEKAIAVAPWMPAHHFNRGLVLEKAEKFSDAARSLELYLLADPAAKDARDVQKKIAGLRFKTELASRPAPAPSPSTPSPPPAAPALSGNWQVKTWDGNFYERPTVGGRWSPNVAGAAQVSVSGARFHATSKHVSHFTMVLDGVLADRRVSGTAVLQGPPACPGMSNQFGFEATVEPDGRRVVVEVKGTITAVFKGGREVCSFEPRARSLSILLLR